MFKALEQDGYLLQFVRRMSFIPKLRSSLIKPSLGHGDEDPIAKVTIPYFHGISEPLGRSLCKLNVEVRYRPISHYARHYSELQGCHNY